MILRVEEVECPETGKTDGAEYAWFLWSGGHGEGTWSVLELAGPGDA